MSPALSDLWERRRALDPTRSFIVQAPAGSGKTELLIRRYLVLLATVEQPEAVVAITFTIKAAGEVRDRVLLALAAARNRAEPENDHERETWQLARSVLARDTERGWHLSEHPERLQIRTIDGLCAAITRRMPLTAGFGAQPEFREDAVDLYIAAARRTLALLETSDPSAPGIATLLRHLDGNLNRAEQLLTDMLPRRDQWLRHLIGGTEIDPEELRTGLEANLRGAVADTLADVREAFAPECVSELMRIARFAARNCDDFADLLNRSELPSADAADLPAWRALRNLVLTANDARPRSRFTVNEGFPRGCREKDQMAAAIANLSDGCIKALHEVRYLPDPRYTPEQWSAVRALLEVLPVAAAQLRLVFAEHTAIDFTELAQGALHALGSAECPSELAYAMDCRIEHILVDEFQDTSATQKSLLERLTGGWTEGDGRTLFCVGDPMQSIFRFREAEVGVFLRARAEGIGALRLEPLTLSANFRSDAALVEWNNRTFSAVFPEHENASLGAITYAPSNARRVGAAPEPVALHPLFGSAEAAEAALVLSLVRDLREADPDGTVALLFRARSHARLIARALRDDGLHYQAVEMNSLADSAAVEDVLALTRALLHPADRIAWLAVLRGPCCGLTLADLTALTEGDVKRTLLDLIADEQRLERMSADGRHRLRRVMDVIAPALRERARLPLRRWVESCWTTLGGPATLRTNAELHDAQVFFELLDEFDSGGGIADFSALYRRIDTLYSAVDPRADSRLQLLTMHKAKGLEFDAVIVPGLGRAGKSDESKLLAWVELPAGLVLAPIAGAAAEKDALVRWLSHMDRRKAINEELRLLYVAATRARRELHLIGNVSIKERNGSAALGEPDARSLLRHIWPSVREAFEVAYTAESTPSSAEPENGPAPRLRRLALEWKLPDRERRALHVRPAFTDTADEPVTFVWAGDTLRHIGTVVHATLQRIAEGAAGAPSHAQWARALRELGVPPSELPGAVERVHRAVSQTLADQRGRWILAAHRDARTEYALSGVVDGRVRHIKVDRTFIDEHGTRWIIDYKTGTHEGADVEAFLDNEQLRYEPQLRTYAELLRRLEACPLRVGLYFPLLGGWREGAFEAEAALSGGSSKSPVQGAKPAD